MTKQAWKPDLKVAAVLGIAGAIASALALPYLTELLPDQLEAAPPLPVLAVLTVVQGAVVLGLLSLVGIRMGHRVELGAPLLQHWVNKEDRPAVRPLEALAIGAGAGVAVLILAAVIDPSLPPMKQESIEPSAISGLLASFYGGIAEELQLRLFLMTLLVWLLWFVRKRVPGTAAYWAAIVAAAVIFGVGHLPAAAGIWDLDALVVTRTIVLNSVAGIAFGWLYWKRGLEMAILAHFVGDIVLHVLSPLVTSA